MDAKIITVLAVAATISLTGCGFKSDLFVPESKSTDDLFTPDGQLEVQAEDGVRLPADASDIVTSDEIFIDKSALTESIEIETDGELLIDTEEEGVPIDLTDLEKDLERKRNNQ